MSTEILELVVFKSAAYTADQAALEAKILPEYKNGDYGVINRYKGVNPLDPNEHCWIIIWKAREGLDKFGKEKAATALGPLFPLFEGPPDIHSIPLNGQDYRKALAAPVVSLSYATPKEGVARETLAPLVENLLAYQSQVKGTHGIVRGQIHEKPGSSVTIIGWDSAEAHQAAAKEERVAAIIAPLREQLSELKAKDMTLKQVD
ncbi:hypothetical protein BDV98DRAFT_607859 [Pterulicium gracile]|uniref:ABM domain-containing protein n=1 Tax=Pterulicium gracile TaxID=1884261 RepID=A0A5C3Q5F6_9AGAR|nr:hypothetical protein BDV98DRAFT_607859 [Pterula gracilis]